MTTKEKIEILPLAGCTDAQVKKYERHLAQRKAGKTPCSDLRRNYNTCNGRLEVYLRQLAKEEANNPRVRQEKKEAVRWAIADARALQYFTSHLPEGYITLDQLFQEELAAAYIEGVNGVLPALDTIDNSRRNSIFEIRDTLKEVYADVAIAINFDGKAYAESLKEDMGATWTDSIHSDSWIDGYSSTQPLAVETKWIRENGVRKDVRQMIEQEMVSKFPSMKNA